MSLMAFFIISSFSNNQQPLIVFLSLTDFLQPLSPPLDFQLFLPDVSLPDGICRNSAASMATFFVPPLLTVSRIHFFSSDHSIMS